MRTLIPLTTIAYTISHAQNNERTNCQEIMPLSFIDEVFLSITLLKEM